MQKIKTIPLIGVSTEGITFDEKNKPVQYYVKLTLLTFMRNWLEQNPQENVLKNQEVFWDIRNLLDRAVEQGKEEVELGDSFWGFLNRCRREVKGMDANNLWYQRMQLHLNLVSDR